MGGHTTADLRPLERRVLRLESQGLDPDEIGRRFKRSGDHIRRISSYAKLPDRGPFTAPAGELRPLERRIIHWRAEGLDYDEIGDRFRRSGDHIRRVEGMALYKMSRRLLEG